MPGAKIESNPWVNYPIQEGVCGKQVNHPFVAVSADVVTDLTVTGDWEQGKGP